MAALSLPLRHLGSALKVLPVVAPWLTLGEMFLGVEGTPEPLDAGPGPPV